MRGHMVLCCQLGNMACVNSTCTEYLQVRDHEKGTELLQLIYGVAKGNTISENTKIHGNVERFCEMESYSSSGMISAGRTPITKVTSEYTGKNTIRSNHTLTEDRQK